MSGAASRRRAPRPSGHVHVPGQDCLSDDIGWIGLDIYTIWETLAGGGVLKLQCSGCDQLLRVELNARLFWPPNSVGAPVLLSDRKRATQWLRTFL